MTMGTLDMAGSEAIRRRNVSIQASESNNPSSMFTSIIWALSSTCWTATDNASSYFSSLIKLANLLEPATLVRSPTLTKRESSLIFKGSRPLSRVNTGNSGMVRGGIFSTACAMACICSGVVPQQPPTIFTRLDSANSPMTSAMKSGDWSYSPNSLGRPALGWTLIGISAIAAKSERKGRISTAPRAQLIPTLRSSIWRTEYQKASMVWPERVRPLASVMVTDTITGRDCFRISKTC